jgi:hypothetical protein
MHEHVDLHLAAHEIDPGSIDALTNLGGYLLEAGLVSEAKRALTAALHIATHGTSQHRQIVAQLLQDRGAYLPTLLCMMEGVHGYVIPSSPKQMLSLNKGVWGGCAAQRTAAMCCR